MTQALAWLTRGNVPEVKIVLASLVAALALYQVALMAVGYDKLRLPLLRSAAPSRAHRVIGDAIIALTLFTALLCLGYYELEDEAALHMVFAIALLAALTVNARRKQPQSTSKLHFQPQAGFSGVRNGQI